MAKQVIGIGTVPNDGTGDTLRIAFDKVNDNFTELYDGAISGLTATRIPYAQDATTLIDSANLTWDNTNAALTVNSQRILSQGTNGTHGHYIGYLAGTTNTFSASDGRNTGFGYRALRSLAPAGGATDSSYNTAMGWDAGQAISTGRFNTCIGYAAGDALTTGIQNTAVGSGALSALQTGSANVAIGINAMGAATGTESVAVGHTALNLLTGQRCVAVGWGALAKNTSGNYNIAIGSESLQENVTGGGNVAIGFYSGVYAKGGDNVFVGNYACGQATVTSTALDGNVMVGAGAGNTDTPSNRSTNHNYSTFVGYQSGLGSTTQCSYSTAIGYRAKVYTDRSMVFGSEVDANRVNYGFGGEGYGGGQGVLFIKNAITNASAAGTNGIIIHSKDSSGGSANATLALYMEESPEATATFTQTHRLKIWINGVEYYISLDTV